MIEFSIALTWQNETLKWQKPLSEQKEPSEERTSKIKVTVCCLDGPSLAFSKVPLSFHTPHGGRERSFQSFPWRKHFLHRYGLLVDICSAFQQTMMRKKLAKTNKNGICQKKRKLSGWISDLCFSYNRMWCVQSMRQHSIEWPTSHPHTSLLVKMAGDTERWRLKKKKKKEQHRHKASPWYIYWDPTMCKAQHSMKEK